MPTTVLDVFKGDAFSVVEMTAAINALPFVPTMIGNDGLFEEENLSVLDALIEFKDDVIYLVPSTERGTVGKKQPPEVSTLRKISIPHFVIEDALKADELQGVRPFGKDPGTADPVQTAVNNKLQRMKNALELTREYLRVGALKGTVIDGDGSTTLLNFFTDFGVTQKVVDFVLGTTSTDVKAKAMEVTDYVADVLGAVAPSGITAYCGRTFWNKLITHPEIEGGMEFQITGKSNNYRLENQGMPGVTLEAFGIMWKKYYAKLGSTTFIPDADCRFAVHGVPDLYKGFYAPADYIETVNTIAQTEYAKQVVDKWDKVVEMEAQTNVIYVCTRPKLLVRGTTSN